MRRKEEEEEEEEDEEEEEETFVGREKGKVREREGNRACVSAFPISNRTK